MIKRKPLYNRQADNLTAAGITAGSQCGYTALGMVLSVCDPVTASDAWIKSITERMETPGPFRSELIRRIGRSADTDRLGASGNAYHHVMRMLNDSGEVRSESVFVHGKAPFSSAAEYLDNGYVLLLSTMLTNYGHFICVYDYTGKSFMCHDPAGDFRKGYFNAFGESVIYDTDRMRNMLKPDMYPYHGGFRFTAVRPAGDI